MASSMAQVFDIQEEIEQVKSQISILQEEIINNREELASIETLIDNLQVKEVQLTDSLESITLNKSGLITENEVLLDQIETLTLELAVLIDDREKLNQGSKEQKVADAISTLNNLELTSAGRCQANSPDIFAIACFESDKEQIVRISHSQLIDLGVNLSGVPKNNIGVMSDGGAVPIFVSADELFDESSFIEIVTEGNQGSIYSNSLSYLIYVDFSEAFALEATAPEIVDNNVAIENASVDVMSNTYIETLHYEKDDFYSLSGLSDFGWTDTQGFHYLYAGQTKSVDVVFELDNEAQLDSYANLIVKYAKSSSSGNLLESVVYLNGTALNQGQISYSGRTETELELEITPGLLQLGENTFSIAAKNLGSARMSFQFDEFSLGYNRSLIAKESALVFDAQGGQYIVSGYHSSEAQDVVVFKQSDLNQVERIAPLLTAQFSDTESQELGVESLFILESHNDTRFIIDRVNSNVELTLPRSYEDIKSPVAEYLIISHPDFIGTQAMTDLVNLRQLEYSVQVVDVDQVYAQYAQGAFDANAIKQFIGDKMNQSSTKMVLLVGDDTYDYKNRLDLGEKSFIPSLYLTVPNVMAADLIYVDHDDNQIPDIAIGRFPVETEEEFSNVVEKTALFDQTLFPKKALVATNYSDGIGETHYQPYLTGLFLSSWETVDITMAEDSVVARDAARANLASLLNENQGSGFMIYTGHNSFSTGPMFSSFDIPLLANHQNPITAVMIDSYTGFYVADQLTDSVGVQAEDLLVAEDVGAAAVFAPSSLVGLQAVQARFISRVVRKLTYGEAYLSAMALSFNLGSASYNLLGDPALRLNTY